MLDGRELGNAIGKAMLLGAAIIAAVALGVGCGLGALVSWLWGAN